MATTKPKSRPAAKKTTKKAIVRKKISESYRTLRVSRPTKPFLTFSLTKQSLYWLIFSIVILAMGIWIVMLQTRINDIYDKIDQNQAIYEQLETIESKIRANKNAINRQSTSNTTTPVVTQPSTE